MDSEEDRSNPPTSKQPTSKLRRRRTPSACFVPPPPPPPRQERGLTRVGACCCSASKPLRGLLRLRMVPKVYRRVGRCRRHHQLGWLLLLVVRVTTLHAWMVRPRAVVGAVVWRRQRRRTMPPSSPPSLDSGRRRQNFCRLDRDSSRSQTHQAPHRLASSSSSSSSSHDAASSPSLPRNTSATAAAAAVLDPPVAMPVQVPRPYYPTANGAATTTTATTDIPSDASSDAWKKDRPPPFKEGLRRPFLHSPDEVATTTLGDIMGLGMVTGAPPTGTPSSSSSTTTSLRERYGISHPLDRVALTANGNLQRLVGSYYDSPVSVVLDSQTRVDSVVAAAAAAAPVSAPSPEAFPDNDAPTSSHVWERAVHLTVFNHTFCAATSIIHVRDPTCQALVESGQVGLGQLFRYLDLLPEFTLLDAGPLLSLVSSSSGDQVDDNGGGGPTTPIRTEDGGGGGGHFWRHYRLECRELSCWIREEFCPGLWSLTPPPPSAEGDDHDATGEAAAEGPSGPFE